MKVPLRAEYGLLVGYLAGVVGTVWDWHEHYVGISNQAPHALIDVGALLVVAVLGFSGWQRFSRGTRLAIYYLLVLVALIVFGPFLLMMTIPHSAFMAALMNIEMTRGAVLLEGRSWSLRDGRPGTGSNLRRSRRLASLRL